MACLACTVRGCGRPLTPQGRAWRCDRGHAFDVARAGYVNLLQPQDRRAAVPGDRVEAAAARERLLASGVGTAILAGVADEARAGVEGRPAVIVDLGAGTGELLSALMPDSAIEGIGLELSTAAIARAARRCPAATWIVANADRRLPLTDACADVVLSMHARRNPAECARVLKPEGSLIVVVPAADDLVELRTAIGGTRVERSRVEPVLREHEDGFALVRHVRLDERHRLDPPVLVDLLHATYRGARESAGERVAGLTTMDVTLASDLLTFRRSGTVP